MNVGAAIFVLSFLATVYFIRAVIRAWRGPEMRRDLERLRENRRRMGEAAKKRGGFR
jgi:hypothetical protein